MSRSRRRQKHPQKAGVRSTRFTSQTYRPRVKEVDLPRRTSRDRRALDSPPVFFRSRPRGVRKLLSATKVESTSAWKAPDYFGRATVIRVMGDVSRESERRRVCAARHVRRAVLFALDVAGVNRLLSPGRGGSYRRTKDSKVKC